MFREKKWLHNGMLLKVGVMLSVEHVAPKKDLLLAENAGDYLVYYIMGKKNLLRFP